MAALTAATVWGMAALTTSRAMFIGGLAGLFIFVLLTWPHSIGSSTLQSGGSQLP